MLKSRAALAILALALLASPAARAEGLLYPELGLGAGPARVGGAGSRAASLDFNFGYDWELDGLVGIGFLAGADWEQARWNVERDWGRFSVTSLLTLSLGHWDILPFARIGLGPSLTFTTSAPDSGVRTGAGLTAEAAVGFRSIVELYAQASGIADGAGLAWGATAGFRLNVWIFDAIFGGGSSDWGSEHRSTHHRTRSAPHRARPIGSD